MLQKKLVRSSTPRKKKVALKLPRLARIKRKIAPQIPAKKFRSIQKHGDNPIIEPRPDRKWESKATFNPGVVCLDGKVHILYRAIGDNDVSVLGYAVSSDGFTIEDRADEPAYTAEVEHKGAELREIPRAVYASGGGWNGGCEDPRLTQIGGKVHLLYTAFDGWGSIRIALSSISIQDFLARKWNWKKPVLISPSGEIHKNWVLFPEKIGGKYAILHSISPDILIDFLENLDELDGKAKVVTSRYGSGTERKGAWDNWIRGAGPPPIKTDEGWLLLYHAMDKRDPGRYKLGAMMLDPNDPTKVLYRSRHPILEPDEYYENHGFKGGVVYSCGASVVGGNLFVYYGGADTVVCVASADLKSFLGELKVGDTPRLRVKPMGSHV